jgi:acetyl-CoA synthetase (ADP-forming)
VASAAAATKVRAILRRARARGQRALSEHESTRVIAAYGVPVARSALVRTRAEAREAARRIGYPVVLKVSAVEANHKTERGLVAVGLGSDRELRAALTGLSARAGAGHDGDFLVQEMVKGSRELMIGMVRDPQFGPCVMFGLGGILSEILRDVAFRVAPVGRGDALELLRGIRAHRVLDAVRGMPAVDLDVLGRCLVAAGRIGLDHPEIAELDINPLVVRGDTPVAVDALVVLSEGA